MTGLRHSAVFALVGPDPEPEIAAGAPCATGAAPGSVDATDTADPALPADPGTAAGRALLRGWDWDIEMFAVFVGVSLTTAHDRIRAARLLYSSMPRTREWLESGRLSGFHSHLLVTAGLAAGPEVAALVDADMLPRHGDKAIPGFRRALARAVARHTPEVVAQDRRERAYRERRVTYLPADDDMAYLTFYGPAAPLRHIYNTFDARARHLRDVHRKAAKAAKNRPSGPPTPAVEHVPELLAEPPAWLDDLTEAMSPANYASATDHAAHNMGGADGSFQADQALETIAPGDPVHADWMSEPPRAPAPDDYAENVDLDTSGDPADDDPLETAPHPVEEERHVEGVGSSLARSRFDTFLDVMSGSCLDLGRGEIQVVVTADALRGVSTEPAQLAGHGPISAGAAREMAIDGVLRRMVTDPLTGHLLDLHPGRYRIGGGLGRFVRARDGVCAAPGCDREAGYLEVDHVIPFPAGTTVRRQLKAHCKRHHLAKTFGPIDVRLEGDGSMVWTSRTGGRQATCPTPTFLDTGPPPDPT